MPFVNRCCHDNSVHAIWLDIHVRPALSQYCKISRCYQDVNFGLLFTFLLFSLTTLMKNTPQSFVFGHKYYSRWLGFRILSKRNLKIEIYFELLLFYKIYCCCYRFKDPDFLPRQKNLLRWCGGKLSRQESSSEIKLLTST